MTARDKLLFDTENGQVWECRYFGRIILEYRKHWLAFDRDGFTRFRNRIANLAMCPLARRACADGIHCYDGNGGLAMVLRSEDIEELYWLMDAAYYILLRDHDTGGMKSQEWTAVKKS